MSCCLVCPGSLFSSGNAIITANEGGARFDKEGSEEAEEETESQKKMNRLAKLFLNNQGARVNIANPAPAISTSYIAKLHPIVYVDMHDTV